MTGAAASKSNVPKRRMMTATKRKKTSKAASPNKRARENHRNPMHQKENRLWKKQQKRLHIYQTSYGSAS